MENIINNSQKGESDKLQEGKIVCEQIALAAKLIKQAEEVLDTAHEAASIAIRNTFLVDLGYDLEVRPEAEAFINAYIVVDDDVVEDSPNRFVATEVRGISKHGVDFLNRRTGQELRIRGFDFSVAPIPPGDDPLVDF